LEKGHYVTQTLQYKMLPFRDLEFCKSSIYVPEVLFLTLSTSCLWGLSKYLNDDQVKELLISLQPLKPPT
jgi:hypothetical protein